MKRKILTMLRQGEDYISGQQICNELGVSRTAVWKAVNGLKNEGYVIEAVQNKGYHLVAAPDVLTEAEIGSRRMDCWKDAPLYVYAETDSTNNRIRQLVEEGAPEGTLAVSDVQTGGKGRRGRTWQTPAGVAIAMSFGLKPSYSPTKASMITLVAALACTRAVEELTGENPKIKWPNDLVLNRKKITGILTEMILEQDYIQQIIVGIGFNVHHDFFPEELADKATSLWIETGKRFSRAELICLVMKYFTEYYSTFEKTGDLAFMQEEYNSYLVSRNQEVQIISPGSTMTGVSLGINETGGLLVKDEAGQIHEITAGEVSVRGLYSYI